MSTIRQRRHWPNLERLISSPSELAAEPHKWICSILVYAYNETAIATGFLVKGLKTIFTTAHTLSGAEIVEITFPGQPMFSLGLFNSHDTCVTDSFRDFAAIRIPSGATRFDVEDGISLDLLATLKPKDDIWIYGYQLPPEEPGEANINNCNNKNQHFFAEQTAVAYGNYRAALSHRSGMDKQFNNSFGQPRSSLNRPFNVQLSSLGSVNNLASEDRLTDENRYSGYPAENRTFGFHTRTVSASPCRKGPTSPIQNASEIPTSRFRRASATAEKYAASYSGRRKQQQKSEGPILVGRRGDVKSNDGRTIKHLVATEGGNSGAPILLKCGGSWRAVGIHLSCRKDGAYGSGALIDKQLVDKVYFVHAQQPKAPFSIQESTLVSFQNAHKRPSEFLLK